MLGDELLLGGGFELRKCSEGKEANDKNRYCDGGASNCGSRAYEPWLIGARAMSAHFPLIEKWLGLEVVRLDGAKWYVVRAEELESALAKGVRMYGIMAEHPNLEFHREQYDWSTHEYLAIGIREIPKVDTAEGLLRELADEAYYYRGNGKLSLLVGRARKLLSKGEK
jgi:hypothetical protein